MWNTIPHLGTDGSVTLQQVRMLQVLAQSRFYLLQARTTHGGLRKQDGFFMPVHRLHLLGKLKHQCFVVGLLKQACHFGMPLFSVNEHLTSFGLHFFPGFMYSFLELAYNGTGGINEFSSFPFYLLVGGRRFSMGSEKQGLFFVLRQLVELGRMEPQAF